MTKLTKSSQTVDQSGQPSQPLIESAARQTTFVWNQVFQDRLALPSNEAFLSANGFRTHETLLEGESASKGAQVSISLHTKEIALSPLSSTKC